MPTTNLRVTVVMEKLLYDKVKNLAKSNGLSISLEARELIKNGLGNGGGPVYKPYTGKRFQKLIGKYKMGKGNPDEILAEQVHGKSSG